VLVLAVATCSLLATPALAEEGLSFRPRKKAAPPIEEAPPDPAVHPLWGASLGIGFAFGGEEPDTGGVLAGDGVALTLGTTLTPVWAGRAGFGLGLDFGIKYAATQSLGGSFEILRYPIVPSAHVLVRVGGAWFLRAAGGPYIEVAIKASRGGTRSANTPTPERTFPSAIGAMGEAGVLYTLGKLGAHAGVRYTTLSYETPSDTDASSWGLFMGIHYFFL
jgi:hypothetical protein